MIPLEFRRLGIHPESTWKGWDGVPFYGLRRRSFPFACLAVDQRSNLLELFIVDLRCL